MPLSTVGTEGVADASIKAADLNADVITGMTAASPAAAADDDVILMYDTSASALRKVTRGNFKTAAISALNDITNVTITSIASGELLKWNGSAWVNNTLAEAGIETATIKDADNNTKVQVEESADENKIRFDTAGTERMIIAADGKVGIGTATPDSESLLDLGAGENSGYTRKLNITNTGNSRAGLGALSNIFRMYYADDQSVQWGTVSRDGNFTFAEKMRLANDGKVGIGETSPLAHVHIKTGDTGLSSLNTGADELFLESATNTNCGMTIASGNGLSGYLVFADQDSNFRGVVQYDHSVPAMRFHVEGLEKFRIKSDGSATGQFVARAWCRYNGTGTAAIDDSHNASSLNDYGTGDQKIIWSITMATTNYCAIGLCGNGSNVSRNMSTKTYATTSTRFMYGEDNGSNQDMSQCNAVIFGD